MTQSDPHAPSEHVTADASHAHAPAGGDQAYFPPEQWHDFREADKTAASYIVVLMQGIFIVGLFLYLVVLWSVT